MTTVHSFEDLCSWQKAQDLAAIVYQRCESNAIVKDYSFKDQIKRAALSISNNIAEGFEYNNNNDFIGSSVLQKDHAVKCAIVCYLALK